jgi:S1-C subfamily serine protease
MVAHASMRARRAVRTVGRALAFVVIGAVLGAVGVWGTGAPAPPNMLNLLRMAGLPVHVRASGSQAVLASRADLFDETTVTAIYERAAPSIVEIAVVATGSGRRGGGSGVLVAPNGTVLTNYHVVRAASTIEVTLRDHRRFVAKVLGIDPQDDIALLDLTGAPAGLPLLPLGDSDALRPGAMAIAIGNPMGLDRSISVGVIAGLGRTLRDGDRPMRNVIQVDAALNPGNSGGALLDTTGQVMGVTNAIERVPGRAGGAGIGFAVPSSSVRRNFARLLAGERIRHAYVGISGQDLGASVAQELGLVAGPGIAVSGVAPSGPAAQAGLRKGDAIVAVGPWRVTSMEEFGAHVDRTYRPGDTVTMEVRRAGATLRVDVILGAWPDAEDAT